MTRKIREFNKRLKNHTRRVAEDLANTSFSEKRSGPKDRRQLHTFIMNDRRSGIADRRRKAKDET